MNIFEILGRQTIHTAKQYERAERIQKILLLEKQHLRQCENSCNGYGYVPRKGFFYNGTIDEYAKREYGYHVKSAYISETEETVFDKEIEKIQDKILKLAKDDIKVTFQHDPRGRTVQIEGFYYC